MIVVVCSVLVTRGPKVLLVREAKEAARDKYGLPGGKLEQGEDLRACAVRECKEETGLDVEIEGLVMVSMKPMTHEGNTVLRYIYKAKVRSGEGTAGELNAVYMSREEVEELVSRSLVRGQDVVALLRKHYDGTLAVLPEPEIFL